MSTALDFDEHCGAEAHHQGANGVAFAGTWRPADRREGTPIYAPELFDGSAPERGHRRARARYEPYTEIAFPCDIAKAVVAGKRPECPWRRACPIGSLRSFAAWSTRRHSPVVHDGLLELDAQCRTEQTGTGRFWVILTRRRRRAAALAIGSDNGVSSTADLRTGFGKI